MIRKNTSKGIPKFDGHERFLSKIRVDLKTKCWEWVGNVDPKGYGEFPINSRKKRAHRVSYDIFKGLKANGLLVDHTCRNKKCVNPDHLREVNNRINSIENSTSVSALNVLKSHCPKGHEYLVNNIMWVGKNKIARRCRTCHREKGRVNDSIRSRKRSIARLF